MSEEKKVEENKKRQIIIETDGNSLNIVKAEIAGNMEFIGILETILQTIRK